MRLSGARPPGARQERPLLARRRRCSSAAAPKAVPPGDASAAAGLQRVLDAYEGFRASGALAGAPDVGVAELLAWQTEAAAGGRRLVLVDARTDAEVAVSTLPGAVTREAALAGAADLRATGGGGGGARAVAFCTLGLRSAQATLALRAAGLDAYNLRGSLLALTYDPAAALVVPATGAPTRRLHTWSQRWAMQAPGYTAVWFDQRAGLLAALGAGLRALRDRAAGLLRRRV